MTKELTTGLEAIARLTSSASTPQELAAAENGSNESSRIVIQWDEILGRCSKIYPELFPPASAHPAGGGRQRRARAKFNGDIVENVKVTLLTRLNWF